MIYFYIFRRVQKYGVTYSPTEARSLKLATDEDDLAALLKSFCRIFMNPISSVKPSECLVTLASFEDILKDHLLQQRQFLPSSTVKYMESWKDGPMISHWNLYAMEMQLPHPNPQNFISVPMSTFRKMKKFLIRDENAMDLVDEMDACKESAAALLDKCTIL